MMDEYSIDTTHWPVVVIKFIHTHSLAGLEVLLRDLEGLYKRGEKNGFVIVFDCRQLVFGNVSAAVWQRLAEGSIDLIKRYPNAKRGEAFVADSKMSRATLTAVNYMRRPAFPIEVFATVEKAMSWAGSIVPA